MQISQFIIFQMSGQWTSGDFFYSDFRLILPKEYHFWMKIAEKVLTSAKIRRMVSFLIRTLSVQLLLYICQILIKTNRFWRFEGLFFNLNTQNNGMKILRLEKRAKEVIAKTTKIDFKHPRNTFNVSIGCERIRN